MVVTKAVMVWSVFAAAWFAGAVVCAQPGASVAPATTLRGERQVPQDASGAQDLARLREMLGQAGPDGRQERETAIARLLAMGEPAAHRLLQEFLLRAEDPDRVREAILAALQQHVLTNSKQWFGGASDDVRRHVLAGYLDALAPLWHGANGPAADATDHPVLAAARRCLQSVAVRELDVAARHLLASADVDTKVEVLRCLADLQQIVLAQTLADFVAAPEQPVRDQARRSLQLLTYHEEEFQTKADFEAWQQRFGDWRYVDLAERAARLGPRPLERLREELARLRVEAARDFVRAHTVRKPGIDWAAIQARTMVDDPAVLDACLELLQQSLADGLPADDQALPRQAFCRAVLQRFRQVAPEQLRRRALLLEVAAYLCRSDEGDLAAELTGLLLAQLEARDVELQVAALRGLRRFPSLDNRLRLARYATALLRTGTDARDQLLATLTTMASRGAPRWTAPTATDADRTEWLTLVDAACHAAEPDVRNAGLALAQTLDSADQRVPELFRLLLDLARDGSQETRFRLTCLIQLRGWRAQEGVAEQWVLAMHDLLKDPAGDLRRQAAAELQRLTESVDPRRLEWIAATINVLRDRIAVEADATVLAALVVCLRACGSEPQTSANAIGALATLVSDLDSAPPAERELRLEPLLQAMASIAAGPHAEQGQWIRACRQLLQFDKRQSVRLVLQSHGAADLAKLVGSGDASQALPARRAMELLIQTALRKPAKDAWTATPELLQEARDVRVAFGALDTVEEAQRLDETVHRLLRLEVELACGKHQEVVQHASVWLAPGNGTAAGRVTFSATEVDRVRVLAAEAHLALNKPDAAARMLAELSVQPPTDAAVLDLQVRVARLLLGSDKQGALGLLANTWKATAVTDPAFRARLLEWMLNHSRLLPGAREELVAATDPFVAQFTGEDCPSEQRETFRQLRGID